MNYRAKAKWTEPLSQQQKYKQDEIKLQRYANIVYILHPALQYSVESLFIYFARILREY